MVKFDDGSEISEKELFKKAIIKEVGPTKPALCKFAQDFIDNVVQDWFWKASSSSSGKYHPSFANGEGGLARHSLMVYRWLNCILFDQTMSAMNELKENVPNMVVACLLHDCCKRGLPGKEDLEHTVHEHPLYAAKMVVEYAETWMKENKDFIDMTVDDEDSFKQDIAVVVSCIQTHMGRWSKSKHSEIVLPVPANNLQYMVHLADYISSKKFTSFDLDFFSDLMNEK